MSKEEFYEIDYPLAEEVAQLNNDDLISVFLDAFYQVKKHNSDIGLYEKTYNEVIKRML